MRWTAALALVGILGCGVEVSGSDAGLDAAAADAGCARDGDCDDGLFCNGAERCSGGACAAGAAPCAASETCDEAGDHCEGGCPDADGDGARSIACGGADCDDADPDRFPGHPEVCDALDHDEDCDARTFGVRDADGDGFADGLCCNGSGTDRRCGTDCDDASSAVHPSEAEGCDGLDNDCDGTTDEGAVQQYFPDCDEDGYGDAAVAPIESCSLPAMRPPGCTGPTAQWATIGTDCDDTRAHVRPGVPEICDRVDDDCDPSTAGTDGDADVDGDPSERCCNRQGDGSLRCAGTDCEPADPTIHGAAPESCNARDDDCDWQIDEGLGGCTATDPSAGRIDVGPCDCASPMICCAGSPTTCIAGGGSCMPGTFFRIACDGAEDCGAGEACCQAGAGFGCAAAPCPTDRFCVDHEDCAEGSTCTVMRTFLGTYFVCE